MKYWNSKRRGDYVIPLLLWGLLSLLTSVLSNNFHNEQQNRKTPAATRQTTKGQGNNQNKSKNKNNSNNNKNQNSNSRYGTFGEERESDIQDYAEFDDFGGERGIDSGRSIFDEFNRENAGRENRDRFVEDAFGLREFDEQQNDGGRRVKDFVKDRELKDSGFSNLYHKEEYGKNKKFFDVLIDKDIDQRQNVFRNEQAGRGGDRFEINREGADYDEASRGDIRAGAGRTDYDGYRGYDYENGNRRISEEDQFEQDGGKVSRNNQNKGSAKNKNQNQNQNKQTRIGQVNKKNQTLSVSGKSNTGGQKNIHNRGQTRKLGHEGRFGNKGDYDIE